MVVRKKKQVKIMLFTRKDELVGAVCNNCEARSRPRQLVEIAKLYTLHKKSSKAFYDSFMYISMRIYQLLNCFDTTNYSLTFISSATCSDFLHFNDCISYY